MHYLSELRDDQTLVMSSGHPMGVFPSRVEAPRLVITNGMVYNSLIGRLMESTWGPPWADRTQVGPMMATWTLLSGLLLPALDKMGAVSQMIFSDAFSWMKSFVFWFKFHWSLFLRDQLAITQHWFRKWLGAVEAPSQYLNQCWPSSLTQIFGIRGRWDKFLWLWQDEIINENEILGLLTLTWRLLHYNDVTMSAMASQITRLTIIYSAVYSGTDQRKHQSSAPLAFVRGIHMWPVNCPHKRPVTRKIFQFDDVIM